MPVQVTVSDIADTTSSEVSRRLWIDGRLVVGDKTFTSINPATGEVLGHTPDAGALLSVPVMGGRK
ncbi:aldehyde dehydrogenase (NAD) family protein [Mycobacterium lentiflavum]|uniref:Aldehyde dehydrogenase (NAD) family protein n=1 Tax=Mycobacterium lentiflavum TaxID=141349 RepID=A0A0E4H3Y7_MYCLN|nr:aldehyde dehydrogenase (NAD) family protein [Mycobacterium lentiflavum]